MATSSSDEKEKRLAKGIISKNLALGLSPAFVAVLIIPLATRVGKKDATQSLFLGIILCVGYFSTVPLPKISYLIHPILIFLGGCLTYFAFFLWL